MNEQLLTAVLQGGSGTALCVVVWMTMQKVLRVLERIEKSIDRQEAREEVRREFAQTPPFGVPITPSPEPKRRRKHDTDEE